MAKATYQQQLWFDFHQEIQYYYYNGEHIYNTPNRERDYARISEPMMESPLDQFLTQKSAFSMPEERARYGEYDEQKMKASITAILDVVEETMLETAKTVGDDVTPKVLAKVKKWVKNPS
jgi:hypothetical protein